MKKITLVILMAISTQMVMAQVPSYVPTNGLVGYWSFNGNANDESGNGNNGINVGATLTSDRFENANNAFDFNGVSSINTNCQGVSNQNARSISFWLKQNLTIASGNEQVIMLYGGSTMGSGFNPIILNLSFPGIDLGASFVTYNYNLLDSWHLFTATYENSDGGNVMAIKIYIDSVLMTNTYSQFQQLNNLMTGNSVNLRFGNSFIPGQGFAGKLDDIGIWNRALTQQEITNLYNSTSSNECLTMTINTGVLSTNPETYTSTVSIYPNPANDQITIDCGTLANVTGWSIKITNMLGQEVFNKPLNTQQYVVPLNTWSGQGMYFVKISNAQNEVVNIKKIILK